MPYARGVFPSARAAAALGTLVLGFALLAHPPAAHAEEDSTAYSGFAGFGSVLCNFVYVPAKITYAIGGTLISGLAYAWTVGDTAVSGPIFYSSVRGDYVVLPEHLEGRTKLAFVGPPY